MWCSDTGVCNSNKKTTLVLIDLPFCWKKDLNSASEMWIPWNRETNVNPFCQRNVYPLCQRYACPLDCRAKLCPAKKKCVSLCSSNQKCIPCAKQCGFLVPHNCASLLAQFFYLFCKTKVCLFLKLKVHPLRETKVHTFWSRIFLLPNKSDLFYQTTVCLTALMLLSDSVIVLIEKWVPFKNLWCL